MTWLAVIVLAAGAWMFKFGGLWLGERDFSLVVTALIGLIPAALFTALIVLQTFGTGTDLTFDARAFGLAAGAVAVWRRLPFIAVIVLAMATTAMVRAIGLAA